MESYENIYKSVCRVCLKTKEEENMVSLTDYSSSGGLSCYGKAVMTFASVHIKFDDIFPVSMCKNCTCCLKQAIYFKLKCESSDKQLKKLANFCFSEREVKQKVVEYSMFTDYFTKEDLQGDISPDKPEKSQAFVQKITGHNIGLEIAVSQESMSDNFLDSDCNATSEPFDTKPPQMQEDCDAILDSIEKLIGTNPDILTAVPERSCKRTHKRHKKQDSMSDNLLGNSNYNTTSLDIKPPQMQEDGDAILDRIEKLIGTHSDIPNTQFKRRYKRIHNRKKKLVKRHIQLQAVKSESLVCNICHRVLANKHSYTNHMQRHTGCRYVCEHCGKGFPVLAELQIHQVAIHSTGPYLQCQHCPYKAPRKFNLVEHERIHTGERPYTCEKCGLTFRRRFIWKKHLIYHNEKTVQCSLCPRKFHLRSEMLAHCNNVHERMYVYLCNTCGATYAKPASVRRHLTERHGVPREMQGKIVRINKGKGDLPE